MVERRIVHVGLFGHVDAGKTALASCLSEVVSTAGLDAHPQARKRGISIDLGFTSFQLGDTRISLVDAPGHADLIRSVVASAGIIEVGMMVIDATKGPELQTGEHLVILQAMGISRVIVALNKVDLIEDKALIEKKIKQTRDFFNSSGSLFKNVPVIPVSSVQKTGFDELAETLRQVVQSLEREERSDGPFVMPFDHHFQVKGFGTVLTGTVLSGTASVGDELEVSPLGMRGKVRSIDVFKERVETVGKGDRAGIALAGLDDSRLYRGCVLGTPGAVQRARDFIVSGSVNRFFKHVLAFGSQVHLTIGMLTVPARFFPFEERREMEGNPIMLKEVSSTRGGAFTAYVRAGKPVPFAPVFKALVSRLDLPPNQLRIAAGVKVTKVLDAPPLIFKVKEKIGTVKDPARAVVENLARSAEGAKKVTGREIFVVKNDEGGVSTLKGRIVRPFGTKGNVIVDIPGATLEPGMEVKMIMLKRVNLPLDA